MKIINLTLNNFSSFEGMNYFDFSNHDSGKNIVLIGGKNGAGKTSLFTAIKIALYGPRAYGYVGINPHYIAKVKEHINTKAFHKERVEAGVSVELSFLMEREIKNYKIMRNWDYTSQRLNEIFAVEADGKRLDEDEKNYFVNYMQSIVPPDLFEFFLFDGEEVGKIFSTSNYNSYVKNAVFTLCGMDIFEILRKNTRHYIAKATDHEDEQERRMLDDIKSAIEMTEIQKGKLEVKQIERKERLDKIDLELIELENAFVNEGGLTAKEKKHLEAEYNEADRLKAESAAKIRMFVEDLMPFYIARGFTNDISLQLDLEEKGKIFNYVKNKIDENRIKAVLGEDKISDKTVNDLTHMIIETFRPAGLNDKFEPVHDLSKETTGRVNAVISRVGHFDRDEMIKTVKTKIASLEKTMEINKILKEAMSDADTIRFTEKERQFRQEREKLNVEFLADEQIIMQFGERLKELNMERERVIQIIKDKARNKHVYDLSNGISTMMAALLKEKSFLLKSNLEKLIVKNLKRIYRKDNLITHIEIDDNFQLGLYQEETYRYGDIAYLIKNLGIKGFGDLIGNAGKEKVAAVANATKISDAAAYFESNNSTDTIVLYKKIELGRLSKGERQIFILALYWAVIELSDKDIPFIIDTPYARIDANHRKEISEKFFPNISKQVIILSTDEEISAEYYAIIKPYIAKEYLLVNDEGKNKTSVENHYFFEG